MRSSATVMSRAHRSDRATIEKLQSLDEVLAAKLMRRHEIAACQRATGRRDKDHDDLIFGPPSVARRRRAHEWSVQLLALLSRGRATDERGAHDDACVAR